PGELDFRVRDGNGYDLSGIAAGKKTKRSAKAALQAIKNRCADEVEGPAISWPSSSWRRATERQSRMEAAYSDALLRGQSRPAFISRRATTRQWSAAAPSSSCRRSPRRQGVPCRRCALAC